LPEISRPMGTTKIDDEVLGQLLELSRTILNKDYSKRIVADFSDDVVNQIINNLNQHVDNLMLTPGGKDGNEIIDINHFIDAISSFANHDFNHKLPISDQGTILDAIATGINTLGDELEQSTASKYELEKERNRLNEAQAIVKIGSWEFNVLTSKLTGSRELYRIFELEETSPTGLYEAYRSKYHSEDLPKLDILLENAIKKEEGFVFEHRIICRDNSIKYLSGIGKIVKNSKGDVTGIKGTVQDITDRKNAEIELSNSFDIVTDQNKRLLNFSYIVSHNLRSHAGNIGSLIGLLEETNSPEEKVEIMRHMKVVSNLLNETMINLNDIVSIQKNINLVIEPLNVKEYINKAIGVLREQILLKKATINNSVPDNLVVNYNPAYLESIVLNFLSNSIKYSDPERPPIITIDCFEESDMIVMQIADNGVGIDMEKYGDKLFGMYKTFHGNKDARGIGLFISKNQIEAMGGKIEVESKLGKGTTFKIYVK
jgi:PAS domain-containing protein